MILNKQIYTWFLKTNYLSDSWVLIHPPTKCGQKGRSTSAYKISNVNKKGNSIKHKIKQSKISSFNKWISNWWQTWSLICKTEQRVDSMNIDHTHKDLEQVCKKVIASMIDVALIHEDTYEHWYQKKTKISCPNTVHKCNVYKIILNEQCSSCFLWPEIFSQVHILTCMVKYCQGKRKLVL